MAKDKKEKCMFSQNGICVCWEKDGEGKCDGINIPKDCPDTDMNK